MCDLISKDLQVISNGVQILEKMNREKSLEKIKCVLEETIVRETEFIILGNVTRNLQDKKPTGKSGPHKPDCLQHKNIQGEFPEHNKVFN